MSKWKFMLLAGAAMLAPLSVAAQEAPMAEMAADAPMPDPMSPEALAEAKAKMQAEVDKALVIVERIYGTDKLPPVAPAQLSLAKQTTGALVPPGSLEAMMDNLYGKLFRGLLAEFGGLSDLSLSFKTGVDSAKIAALDVASKEAIADIFDPNRKARDEQMMSVINPLISEVLRDIEAPLRDGMAVAFARKFNADQLSQMNGFFATPAGSAYAGEWMALQADPAVMLAMIKAMPPLIGKYIDRGPELEGKLKDLPKEKQLADLTDSELAKIAGLMKVDVAVLKEQRDLYKDMEIPADEMMTEDAWAAADAAGAAADAAAGGMGEWSYAENWSEEDRAETDRLREIAVAASEALAEAEYAAGERARVRMGGAGAPPSD